MIGNNSEPIIYSMGINAILIQFFLLSGIHEAHYFFKLILEICLILFPFQLGAIKALALDDLSLEEYFFKDGG